jgi:DNA-binding MarR family transcriptional regulator
MRVKMEEIGLHRAQGFALFYLGHREGMPQSEIARGLHLSAASVTSLLQRMERDGWVVRQTDAADQRVSRVYLTPKARDLHREAHASFHEFERELTAALSEAERAQLRALLQKVHARLAAGAHGRPSCGEAGEEDA